MPQPDQPVVSVIMPAFNSVTTIRAAIESALNQTHPHIEVLVIDDGSTDGTPELVRSTFGNRVTLLRAPHGGRSRARNLGIEAATGAYIQYLDADDLLAPNKIALQVDCLEADPTPAGAHGLVEAFEDDDPEQRWHFRPESLPDDGGLEDMIEHGFLLTLGTLVRTSWVHSVGGFDPAMEPKEDWEHWLRIAAAGGRFVRCPVDGTVGLYRQRDSRGTTPRDAEAQYRGALAVLSKTRRLLTPQTARAVRVRRSIGMWRFGYGRRLVASGRRWAGLGSMVRGATEDVRGLSGKVARIAADLVGGARAEHRLSRRPFTDTDTDNTAREPGSGTTRVVIVNPYLVLASNRTRWERLAELHPDIDVTLLTADRYVETRYGATRVLTTDPEERGNNYHVHPVARTKRGLYRTTAPWFGRLKPDVIHILEEPTEWMLLQMLLLARIRAPRAVRYFFFMTNQSAPPQRWHQRLKMWLVFHLADGAVASSRGARDILREMGFSRPIDIQALAGTDEVEFSPRAGKHSGGFTVGYLGALSTQKGLDTLADAVVSLQGDWRLLVGGDGPERTTLERILIESGSLDRLELAGFIERPERADFLRRAHVVVLPSRTEPRSQEQFGLVVVEAMLCGVPVVGSDSGAIPEVIGDAGLIFPEGDISALADHLERLREDAGLREDLARRGRERALARYSGTALAEESYDFYRRLASSDQT